ncbi:MAG: methyltransferase domain-containing protein [Fulvivirga sp.]|uniref:methyltransferase domain-containing protein n=1 Tax=Fulvivirga sp. TaxID=1931237 RepID=UPI0032EBC35C
MNAKVEIDKQIGDYWSKKKTSRNRWWFDPRIIQYINYLVCGERLNGRSEGIISKLRKIGPFEKGISVGCGVASKELRLLRKGIVNHFDLYELSEERIKKGQINAKKNNLHAKVNFNQGDVFSSDQVKDNSYDFVHWNSSLHHMFDVDSALTWSKRKLKTGGVLYLEEYTGPNRLQYTDEMLQLANSIRRALPERLFLKEDGEKYAIETGRINKEKLIEMDPSEAPDSENIIPSLLKHFPQAEVFPEGGLVYNISLKGLYDNLQKESEEYVQTLMIADELAIKLGFSLRHSAIAQKSK